MSKTSQPNMDLSDGMLVFGARKLTGVVCRVCSNVAWMCLFPTQLGCTSTKSFARMKLLCLKKPNTRIRNTSKMQSCQNSKRVSINTYSTTLHLSTTLSTTVGDLNRWHRPFCPNRLEPVRQGPQCNLLVPMSFRVVVHQD